LQHSAEMALSTAARHYAECQCPEWQGLFIVMLNVVILSVVMLNVVMLSVMGPLGGGGRCTT
jgi:hypothetical protein